MGEHICICSAGHRRRFVGPLSAMRSFFWWRTHQGCKNLFYKIESSHD
jgi:hypothetical protein